MKKSISIFLAVILAAILVLPAAAYHDIEIIVSYDSSSDSVSVRGTVDSDKGSIPLTLEMTDPSGKLASAAQTTAVKNNDGTVGYAFEKIYLPYQTVGGIYTVTVSGHFVDCEATETVKIPGAESMLSLMTSLDSSSEPYSVVKSNASDFGIDISSVEALGENGQKMLNSLINDIKYELPSDAVSATNAALVKETFKKACAEIEKSIKIAEFADVEDSDDLVEWIDNYYKEYGFNSESDATEESEKELTKYVELVKEEAEFCDRLKEQENLNTPEKIQKALYEAAVLTAISTQNDYQVINAVKTFKAFFPVEGLTESELASKCEDIRGNYYESFEDVCEAIGKKNQSKPSNTGSSGSSGSGKWGGEGDTTFIPSAPKENTEQSDVVFTDINEAKWAEKAIISLAEKKIISGRGNRIFAPNDNVTRAEMIKILLLASGVEIDETLKASFSDVADGAWYAPYVATAEKSGLAKGTDDGKFMPESKVTRQDMAVLLFRAFGYLEGNNPDFTDADKIADYAKAAVGCLSEKGIISGVGDESFAPLSTATRAQVAQMVFNALSA